MKLVEVEVLIIVECDIYKVMVKIMDYKGFIVVILNYILLVFMFE